MFQLAFKTHRRAAWWVWWEVLAFSFSPSNENNKQQPKGSENLWLALREKKKTYTSIYLQFLRAANPHTQEVILVLVGLFSNYIK